MMYTTYNIVDDIAHIGLHVTQKSTNILGPQVFKDLKKHIQHANQKSEVSGIILHSEREDFVTA